MIAALRSTQLRFAFAFLTAFAGLSAVGCSAKNPFQKKESVEEGTMAAQRSAQSEAMAQAAEGDKGLTGTPSSIPSLVPGEGHVSLQHVIDAPPTAPPADKFDNDDPAHLLARCRDRKARHEWFDAVGDCRRSAELSPQAIEPWVELMYLLNELEASTEAEIAATKVLAARPNDALALYYLAWSYSDREKFPQAIGTLKRAIAIEPARLDFVRTLAVTYRRAHNYGKSIETLELLQKQKPDDNTIQKMLVDTRAEVGAKLEPYHKLVREKPDSRDNHAALGFMYQQYGMSQRALKSYDIALSKIPTPIPNEETETRKLAAQIYYNRGVVYRDLGRPEVAEPAIWQAMQLDSSLASFAWYYIGLCRFDMGKYDTSIEALRKSVDLAPDVADNRAALADAYTKSGNTALAAEQRNAVAAIEARAASEKAAIAREEAVVAQQEKAGPNLAAPGASPIGGPYEPAASLAPAATPAPAPVAAPAPAAE